MKKIMTFITMFILTTNLFANQIPRSLATDSRVKVVAYDPENIVSIHGSHFVSTAIFMAKNEHIVNVDIGDQLAWEIAIAPNSKNVMFVKPKLPDSDTNMTVLTDKRIYRFHLMTHQHNASSKGAVYSIQFRYADEERLALQQEIGGLQHSLMGSVPTNAVSWNYDYSFYGTKRLAPIQVVDNGTFTVFKFAKNTPIPAIFAVDKYRNEAMVNFSVQGNYVFVQGIKRQYSLRNGTDVTTIYNDNYAF
jgi:type IV secretion system protein VirB9